MTLVFNKRLGDNVPHEIMSYHSCRSITDMSEYVIRTEEDDENAPTFGLEIEISRGSKSITDTMIEKIFEIFKDLQIESDGSIPGNGMELITAPFTLKAMYELPFEELFKYLIEHDFKAFGVTSTDSGNGCGGHIHISKGDRWEDVVSLMAMFIDQNKEIVQIICKRPFTNYAINNLRGLGKSVKRYYLPEVKSYILDYACEHSNTLNLQHSRTIEFRLPIGTINYTTKMAHVEFLNNLYKCCEDVVMGRARIDRLTINKVCQEGKYLPNYIKELCISCSKKLTIYDAQIKKQVREVEEKKHKLIKILSNLQYELGVTRDVAIAQGSINTISRHFNNITGSNGLDMQICYMKELKNQTVISRGLEDYLETHNNKITKYYKELKDYLHDLDINDVYYNIEDEM